MIWRKYSVCVLRILSKGKTISVFVLSLNGVSAERRQDTLMISVERRREIFMIMM